MKKEKLKRTKERKMKSSAKKQKMCLSSTKSAWIACPKYESFWRMGYGPPGGDKMDEAVWKKYFDEMPRGEYHKMMTRVYRGRCNMGKYEGEWDGYRPPDALMFDFNAWKEYVDPMPKNKPMLYQPHYDGDPEIWAKYRKQARESEGFDIDVYPPGGCCGAIQPMFSDTSPVSANTFNILRDCSRIAVDAYNQREGTDYTVNRVVKSCQQAVAGRMYYITFEAINSKDHLQVLQAMVYVPPMNEEKEVIIVRPKAMDGIPSDKYKLSVMIRDWFTPPLAANLWEPYLKQIKESEGFDIDVYLTDGCGIIIPMFNDMRRVTAKTYHMLSNCSRIAVDAYNQWEGTDYSVIRVVKVCQQLVAGKMYFITFEAINSKDHLQVFQAMVYDPMIEANKVLLVRPKAMDGMPSDKRSNMMKDLFVPPRDCHLDAKIWKTYLKQIKESEGFDIDVCISDGGGTIVPVFFDMCCLKTFNRLINYSRNALDAYNHREV
ncbi:hypothetical protein LIER_42633 [Lithospermum erythrorhizon]|uniref:Cystatin domain-containing protein n=1 Tax=Lithospermum erythrorhizon TaxID=34254 RepID=A0AAV3NT02_LITER